MVTWEQFEAWLKAHDLPTTAVQRIELLTCAGGAVHLSAEVVKFDDRGNPIVRLPDGDLLTEVLVRPMVYLPGDEPPQQT